MEGSTTNELIYVPDKTKPDVRKARKNSRPKKRAALCSSHPVYILVRILLCKISLIGRSLPEQAISIEFSLCSRGNLDPKSRTGRLQIKAVNLSTGRATSR